MLSIPVSFDFCTDTNRHNGALDFRLMCCIFVAATEFAQDRHLLSSCCTGYSTFLEIFLLLKKGYLKNVFGEEKNLPEFWKIFFKF